MSVINQNLLLTPEGYQISRSVRLRSSASAYFNRTPASAGNRQKFTWSGWVKLGSLTNTLLFSAGTSTSNVDLFYFNTSTNQLYFNSYQGAYVLNVNTNAVYRDPSAWYHIVLSIDTTQATSTNRIAIYVNGVSQTLSTGTSGFGSQNQNCLINSAVEHDIGRYVTYTNYFDGYLTEVNFIDGQALTPASFGETDAVTGVWKPKKYGGTYGTNGFYLNFSDNSAATAAAIGKDYSGNGNNWTPNNISVTAGVTYDSMLDVPTMWADGGNGRGNYAVLNVLKKFGNNFLFSAGNISVTDSSGGAASAVSTMSTGTSGKYYFECTMTAVANNTAGSGSNFVGVCRESEVIGNTSGFANGSYRSGSPIYNLAQVAQTAGATYTTGDVIGVAVDVTNGTVQFYKNNVAQGATPSFTFTAGTELWPFVTTDNVAGTKTFDLNFGQRPFAYTPPTGFKALNTQNLPDSTIKKGNAYFDATTYTGNGDTSQTRVISNGNFQPDLVWVKSRSAANGHALQDSVRGAGGILRTELTAAELTGRTDILNGFSSTGFVVGGDALTNANAATYVGWQWKESASAGFDIVTYTGNGSAQTVAHSLGVVPRMIILKMRSGADQWPVYHASVGNTGALRLNLTDGTNTSSLFWNNTSPTSTTFSLGSSAQVNQASANFVAYLFAEVAGFSKFGSYTGNGSADGPFVYLGFRPKWIMIKKTDTVSDWWVWDTSRTPNNQMNTVLYPNTSGVEASDPVFNFDLLSNGFKNRSTNATVNGSSATYIYAAFAENPFKNSLAR